ncbi:BTAD domain-containing putative transcriptional regulator [Kitasatospora sp. NBC_00315]|uniref:AfsR/SARP family transcriptional regulator n=1 Tax=Kitasatospora sp. NBC_00315 TaxID=2975963 RepID=UPI00352F75B9
MGESEIIAERAPARFTVLGLLAIADSHEVAVLQPSKPAALLAALLVRPNTVVSVESLQRVIWGEETPATAKAALQTCVLRLRRLFGKYGIAGNTIEAVPGGYRMAADPQTLDLLRFRSLVGRAGAAGDLGTELALLRSALALWQLPLLTNVHSDALHRDDVPGLTEEWLRSTERVFDIELALGRCREALADLRPVAHAHPLHERFSEQLVEALHRSGRRGEALAECRRVKDHLLAELGVDPGPALQRLELVILRGEPWPGAPGPTARRAAVVPSGRPLSPGPLRAATLAELPGRSADPVTDDTPQGQGAHRDPGGPATGELVLATLVQAGLLEEAPHGRYRVHDLLRTFTRAAAGSRSPAPPGRAADPQPDPRADHGQEHRADHRPDRRAERPAERRRGCPELLESPRQPAAPLRPTEV